MANQKITLQQELTETREAKKALKQVNALLAKLNIAITKRKILNRNKK